MCCCVWSGNPLPVSFVLCPRSRRTGRIHTSSSTFPESRSLSLDVAETSPRRTSGSRPKSSARLPTLSKDRARVHKYLAAKICGAAVFGRMVAPPPSVSYPVHVPENWGLDSDVAGISPERSWPKSYIRLTTLSKDQARVSSRGTPCGQRTSDSTHRDALLELTVHKYPAAEICGVVLGRMAATPLPSLRATRSELVTRNSRTCSRFPQECFLAHPCAICVRGCFQRHLLAVVTVPTAPGAGAVLPTAVTRF